MRLLIIRHGESEADILKVHEGRADFPLTERGHEQAERMAEYVSSNYDISKIYSSSLTRAKETALHLSDRTSLPLIMEDMLMEFNNGLIAGLSPEEAKEKYPENPNLQIHEAMYEMESELEFRYRAEFILSKIISENPDNSTIALVSHGGMINQLYRSFLKLPIDTDIYFATGDTGIHEWLVRPGDRRIVMANYIENMD
ncbi:MAG: histidine phosphatase family protein [Tissierellia bacterium]|nr:histidine phosphatase family protein [Tissierellia bacterium]